MEDIGPQLPPHLAQSKSGDHLDDVIGPVRPPDNTMGPSLPSAQNEQAIGPCLPSKNENNEEDENQVEEKDEDFFGPALPPGLTVKKSPKIIGPAMPPNIRNDGDEDEDEFIGPFVPSHQVDERSRIREEMERRSEAMKDKLTGKVGDKKMERESWMLELPPEMSKNFGLGPRSFRSKATDCGDRTVWTDTPADRERKRKEREETRLDDSKKKRAAEVTLPTEEEVQVQQEVAQYNKQNRPQSLLEMHKTKKSQEKPGESAQARRPFDRDRDLNLSRRDPKKLQEFVKSAKTFGDKFSKGTYEKKFL